MKRRLIKYTKFAVSVALILSLVAPSYAALSSSDGSAFVTKAEFDSALADFNARLTTFEAGINSKIDSQVTSYLDRNGIWSGKDQVLSDYANDGLVNDAAHKDSWLFAAFKSTSNTNWQFNKNTYRAFTWPIVPKCNKTGLLYINWVVNNKLKMSDVSVSQIYANGSGVLYTQAKSGDPWQASWMLGYGFMNKDTFSDLDDLFGYTIVLQGSYSISAQDKQYEIAKYQECQRVFTGCNQFFVERDKPVHWVWADSYWGANYVNYCCASRPSSPTERRLNLYFHTLDCKIY